MHQFYHDTEVKLWLRDGKNGGTLGTGCSDTAGRGMGFSIKADSDKPDFERNYRLYTSQSRG
jgi:hypothetical protein